jgi:hypothetical protein
MFSVSYNTIQARMSTAFSKSRYLDSLPLHNSKLRYNIYAEGLLDLLASMRPCGIAYPIDYGSLGR